MCGPHPPKEEELLDLKRWLISNGERGRCPYWYPLIRAARIGHVPAWELAEVSIYWRDRYLAVEEAERWVQWEREQRADGLRRLKAKKAAKR